MLNTFETADCIYFFPLRQAIKTLGRPCEFSEDGCKYVEAGGAISEHEASCSFRKIGCPHFICNEMLAIDKIEAHLKELHSVKTVEPRNLKGGKARVPFIIRYPIQYSYSTFAKTTITHFDKKTFVMLAYVNDKDHNFSIFATILADEATSQKYEVKIAVFDDVKMKEKERFRGFDPFDFEYPNVPPTAGISIRGRVYSIYEPMEDILEDSNGVLEFNKNMARKLTGNTAYTKIPEISFRFKIYKKQDKK